MGFIYSTPDNAVDEICKQLKVTQDIQVSFSYEENAPLRVEKRANEARIAYGRRVELFRGLGLLAEHSGEHNYSTTQSHKFQTNGVMLDCSRNGVAKVETVKKLIRYMALMGLNMLMLYTEDTYEIPEYPYFGYMRGKYTIAEIQEMDSYAASYGIEMIPCIQTLAHLAATLRWPCFEGMTDNSDILLCGEERTYEFIDAMLRACRTSYKTKRIHIGMDEAFMLGLGQYRVKNGIQKREDIFCKHLQRVTEICEKYDFRPMIWSDMFFRIAFGGDYSPDGEISKEVMQMVPDNVDLVYWDYYRHEKDAYGAAIESHLKFETPVLFAGGAWRWTGYTPHTVKSLEASRAALAACGEKGVSEVFCTAWGDGGNETPIFVILPTIQLYAELDYQNEVSDEVLNQRLQACTGENLSDCLLMDLPDQPDGKYFRIETNPSRYLLYSDVLGSVFEKHTEECYKTNYAIYAAQLTEASKRSADNGYMYEMLASLCDLLAVKSCISLDAYQAYQSKDLEALKTIADETLPEALVRLEKFRASVEKRWMTEYKASGYDVLDFRLGGVRARMETAVARIHAYLNGELDCLEELEYERLSFNGLTDQELMEKRTMCWGITGQLYTPNVM